MLNRGEIIAQEQLQNIQKVIFAVRGVKILRTITTLLNSLLGRKESMYLT